MFEETIAIIAFACLYPQNIRGSCIVSVKPIPGEEYQHLKNIEELDVLP